MFPALFKISELYPHISREWLFFAEGEMLKPEGGPPVSQSRGKEFLLKIEQLSGLLIKLENQAGAR